MGQLGDSGDTDQSFHSDEARSQRGARFESGLTNVEKSGNLSANEKVAIILSGDWQRDGFETLRSILQEHERTKKDDTAATAVLEFLRTDRNPGPRHLELLSERSWQNGIYLSDHRELGDHLAALDRLNDRQLRYLQKRSSDSPKGRSPLLKWIGNDVAKLDQLLKLDGADSTQSVRDFILNGDSLEILIPWAKGNAERSNTVLQGIRAAALSPEQTRFDPALIVSQFLTMLQDTQDSELVLVRENFEKLLKSPESDFIRQSLGRQISKIGPDNSHFIESLRAWIASGESWENVRFDGRLDTAYSRAMRDANSRTAIEFTRLLDQMGKTDSAARFWHIQARSQLAQKGLTLPPSELDQRTSGKAALDRCWIFYSNILKRMNSLK